MLDFLFVPIPNRQQLYDEAEIEELANALHDLPSEVEEPINGSTILLFDIALFFGEHLPSQERRSDFFFQAHLQRNSSEVFDPYCTYTFQATGVLKHAQCVVDAESRRPSERMTRFSYEEAVKEIVASLARQFFAEADRLKSESLKVYGEGKHALERSASKAFSAGTVIEAIQIMTNEVVPASQSLRLIRFA